MENLEAREKMTIATIDYLLSQVGLPALVKVKEGRWEGECPRCKRLGVVRWIKNNLVVHSRRRPFDCRFHEGPLFQCGDCTKADEDGELPFSGDLLDFAMETLQLNEEETQEKLVSIGIDIVFKLTFSALLEEFLSDEDDSER